MFKKNVLFYFFLSAFFCQLVFGAKNPPLATVTKVDLPRYEGKWYEIARLPNSFQKKCLLTEANYKKLNNNSIEVINTCITKSGKLDRITGVAKIKDQDTNAKLAVRFNNLIFKIFFFIPSGKYWILQLSSNESGPYEYAVVGDPSRKFLWVLSRNPTMSASTYSEILKISKTQGFAVEKMFLSRELN